MSLRFFTRTFRRVLAAVLCIALVGAVAFFVLTRTQVGRDSLRTLVEARFNARFEGRLEIGRLQGNLVNDLYASDVRLVDPEGRLVLAVDSIVAEPRWRALFSREFSTGTLTLFQPTLHLLRRADGSWNAERALQPRLPDGTPDGMPVAFSATKLRIVDGTIVSENAGAPPGLVADHWLFDYTESRARRINARGTVAWDPDGLKQVDLLAFSAALPTQETQIDLLRGQLVLRENALALNQVHLESGATQLAFSAAADSLRRRSDGFRDPILEIDLASSRLDFDQLRHLVPRLPLAEAVTASAQVRGALSALSVDALSLARGATHLEARGVLRGLPAALDFEVTFPGNVVATRDLRAVLPGLEVPHLDHLGRLEVDLRAEGTAALHSAADVPSLRIESEIALRDSAGALSGTLTLARRQGEPLHYTAQLEADTLDLGAIAQSTVLRSRLNGRLRVDGEGTDPDALRGTLGLHLVDSHLAGRPIASLDLDLHADSGRAGGTLAFAQPGGGHLYTVGAFHAGKPRPTYWFEAASSRLNLGPLLRSDTLETRLNARLEGEGEGISWEHLRGTLALTFDSSEVQAGMRLHRIPPHRSTLMLAERSRSGPRLRLDGDLATLAIEGEVAARPLFALTRLWGQALSEAARRALDKPYAQRMAGGAPLPSDSSALLSAEADLRKAARIRLRKAGVGDTLVLNAHLSLKRPDILAAFFPALPRTPLSARLTAAASPDWMMARGTVTADTLQAGILRARTLRAAFHARGALEAPPAHAFTAALDATADSLQIGGGVRLSRPILALTYRERTAQIHLSTAASAPQTGPFRLTATLDLLLDRNRLTVHDFSLAAGRSVWENRLPHTIDLYADAVDIPELILESRLPDTRRAQRVRLRGTLSNAPTDTVLIEAHHIFLRPLTGLAALERPIGGLLNGQVALTGGFRQPELTGTVTIGQLSFGSHLLGRLQVSSQYVPGSPEVALEAALMPLPAGSPPPLPLAEAPLRSEESKLRLHGTFRLPHLAPHAGSAGALNLSLDVDYADLFFFEFLFDEVENAEGYLTGSGTIRGTFRQPLFEADMQAVEGAFDLPLFGLSYQLEGPVRVDREGIKLDAVRLTDPTEGEATLSGAILFNDYDYFSFDLQATLDELQIIDVSNARTLPFYGSIWASGQATLTGPLDEALLRSTAVRTAPRSELFIPVTDEAGGTDTGFIIFADSAGRLPDLERITRRQNVLADRPAGERSFMDGLEMDLNLYAPEGSTVHLVFDPLLGDVINAVGSGRIQLLRRDGDFATYGAFEVTAGDYLFTAGEVFFRRFLIDSGTLTWDGDPVNAQLDLTASYRTRVSTAGLPEIGGALQGRIPLVVRLDITGRVIQPQVDLSLAVDRNERTLTEDYTASTLEAVLNQPDREAEYATSVLLTNTFLLTSALPTSQEGALANTGNRLAFNSVSQLVASQLNRYLSEALPNVDLSLALQGENPQDLDVVYGVALRLLDERLIIRGEGIFTDNAEQQQETRGLEGEFIVEVRLNPRVSVEVFYRREGSVLTEQALTSTTGAGLSYQTQFPTWRRFFERLLGWLWPGRSSATPPEEDEEHVAGANNDS